MGIACCVLCVTDNYIYIYIYIYSYIHHTPCDQNEGFIKRGFFCLESELQKEGGMEAYPPATEPENNYV
jgi:hypothetical protein